MKFPGFPPEIADLGDRTSPDAGRKLAAGLLDRDADRPGLLTWRRRAFVQPAQDVYEVGPVREGAPVLVAGNHPLLTIASSTAADTGKIGPRIRFGERRSAKVLDRKSTRLNSSH